MSVPKTKASHQYIFARKSFLKIFSQEIVVLLRKATIYLYNTQKDYLLNPESPAKFFNLHTANISLKDGWVTLKDRSCVETFTHLDHQSQIQKFYKACLEAKTNTKIESLFPKKFKEITERVVQHSDNNQQKENVNTQHSEMKTILKKQKSSRQ